MRNWLQSNQQHNPKISTMVRRRTFTMIMMMKETALLCSAVFLLFFSADVSAKEFRIGLWGDNPYAGRSADVFDPTEQEDIGGISVGVLYAQLRDSINSRSGEADPPAFTFHAGDTKKASTPCYDSKFFARFEQLAKSTKAPVFLALGDNGKVDSFVVGYI